MYLSLANTLVFYTMCIYMLWCYEMVPWLILSENGFELQVPPWCLSQYCRGLFFLRLLRPLGLSMSRNTFLPNGFISVHGTWFLQIKSLCCKEIYVIDLFLNLESCVLLGLNAVLSPMFSMLFSSLLPLPKK